LSDGPPSARSTLAADASTPEQSRIAERADSEEVAELLDRFQAEFDEYTPGAKVLVPRVREHIAGDLSVFLLAGPPYVGVAQLRFREYLITGAPTCYVEELYVVPDRRGQGHGRMLMETALDVARGRGATTMELGTAADDTAARGLYESLGFSNLEKEGRPDTQMLYYEREL
jgi:ribosomal protein S18 acetylase RimI-like enzyme